MVDKTYDKQETPRTNALQLQDQLLYMSRQAELLDEQGHDVSARVMRECMQVLALKAKELAQQTRFKYEANKRADKAEAALNNARETNSLLVGFPPSARGNITHVICFEGEGAEVLLCRGWDDCREQFFNGIFGDGHHDWDEEQVKAWDADFAADDNWTHDEDRRRYCFASDVGEISKVRIYEVSQYVKER